MDISFANIFEKSPYSVRTIRSKNPLEREIDVLPARVRERSPDRNVTDHTMYFICLEDNFADPVELRIKRKNESIFETETKFWRFSF